MARLWLALQLVGGFGMLGLVNVAAYQGRLGIVWAVAVDAAYVVALAFIATGAWRRRRRRRS